MNKTDGLSNKDIKEMESLHKNFKSMIQKLENQNDGDIKRKTELELLSKNINDVLKDNIKQIKQHTGEDITGFLYQTFAEDKRINNNVIKNMEDFFNSQNNGGLVESLFSKQVSRNIILEDLQVVSSYIFQLKEAVNATRDAIVTSDDNSRQIARNITFKNIPEQSEEIQYAINEIEKMEKELKIHHKMKNHIIPKTLTNGEFYVYTPPYSRIIEDSLKNLNKSNVMESVGSITESTLNDTEYSDLIPAMKQHNRNVEKTLNEFLSDIEICNEQTTILDDIVSSDEASEYANIVTESKYNDITQSTDLLNKKNVKSNTTGMSQDGVIDSTNKKSESYKEIKGCMIKLIDPRKLVEVKILDKIIGYYYITDNGAISSNKMSFVSNFKMNLLKDGINGKSAENKFLSLIADRIAQATNKKFLQDNIEFKDLIVNALLYNDTYKKKIKFQFIPVDFITKYSIDEDMNNQGRSMLIDSLFYAKLWLYLLIFKVLTILCKSNDTRFHYVKSSGIDKNTANSIQSATRNLKENQMSFNDLMNYGVAINKIGKGKDVFVSVGSQGERGIETDILSGQDVSLNTELMEMLMTNTINATGVPSVIMSYINEADYSRTLIMANAKFLSRVINYQIDFNDCNTELYKKLAKYHIGLSDKIINGLEYSFAPPKALNNTNLGDIVNNAEQVVNYIVKSLIGENHNPSEDENILKDILFKKISKELLPMIQWSKMEEIFEKSKEDLEKFKAEKKTKPTEEM